MMRLNLNLLPQEQKKETRLIMQLSLLKDTLSRLGLILVFLIFFLSLINLTLKEQLKNLEDSSSLVNTGYANYNFEVAEINKKIASITAAGKQYKVLTPKILELMETIPADIKISSLHMDIYSSEIALPGTARTREDLLRFEEDLKKIEWVTGVDLPKSQLFQKDNIPFEIKIKTQNLADR